MDNRNEKDMMQNNEQQQTSGSAQENVSSNQESNVGETVEKKDESQSYMDYNGNSEANAPARSRE